MTISNYLKSEHRECDDLFAKAEESVVSGDWENAETTFKQFSHDTLRHFKKEEEELFRVFEAQTGNTQGPTMVMRYEHNQVRALIEKMNDALNARDKDAFLSIAESIMILLQQHNMKEEQMLYAMCDRLLPVSTKESLFESMEKVEL